MDENELILDLLKKMIESSNKRMEMIMNPPKTKDGYDIYDQSDIKMAQKEFEMQIKLLDMGFKNLKGGKKPIDVTPKSGPLPPARVTP